VKLASSAIDCTFSGSTAIVVYIANGKLYSCNAGDSRAVLARSTVNSGTGEGKLVAVALSDDQKPEREDEKKRILDNKGRVEACKGVKGEDIGPPRVWLSHQDVPGLAMSRRSDREKNENTTVRVGAWSHSSSCGPRLPVTVAHIVLRLLLHASACLCVLARVSLPASAT